MTQKKHHESTLLKARIIWKIVEKHFEPGRHDRSIIWVFRNIVKDDYPMTERNFWRLLELVPEKKDYLKKVRDKYRLND